MKIKFREASLSAANKERLFTINDIIEEYQADGYVLTLRQLYYQLVSRDVIPNNVREYAKLSGLLTEGRMAGVVDWSAIEDRLRVPESPASWESPESGLQALIGQYASPRQEGQRVYMEVWVEKDALSGVLSRVTQPYHIPIMVNRGYSSVTAMYEAYKRFRSAANNDQAIRVLYVGDHDPSGVDMIRDIRDRIQEFFGDDDVDFEIIPVALLMAQIRQYQPPPNPAKITDPRAKAYIAKHGRTSWEVDALRPEVLNALLENAIGKYLDKKQFDKMMKREQGELKQLEELKEYL